MEFQTDKKTTSEKPVKILLPFIETLEGLLSTKSPKDKDAKEKDNKPCNNKS